MRWAGVVDDSIITAPSGKSIQLRRGDVLEIPAATFIELKAKLGDKLIELTPDEVLQAVTEAYGGVPLEPLSSVRYVPCRECKGIPAMEDAITVCARCGGRGTVLRAVQHGKAPIMLPDPPQGARRP